MTFVVRTKRKKLQKRNTSHIQKKDCAREEKTADKSAAGEIVFTVYLQQTIPSKHNATCRNADDHNASNGNSAT